MAGQHDIRLDRQISSVKAEAVAKPVEARLTIISDLVSLERKTAMILRRASAEGTL